MKWMRIWIAKLRIPEDLFSSAPNCGSDYEYGSITEMKTITVFIDYDKVSDL